MGKYEDRATAHSVDLIADGREADADIAERDLQVEQAQAATRTVLARAVAAEQDLAAANATIVALRAEVARLQAIIDGDTEPPPPPPPVGVKTRYGSSAGGPGQTGKERVNNANTLFGGIDVLRAFQSNPMPSGWTATTTAQHAPTGCAVIVSDKENVKSYVNGSASSKKIVADRNLGFLRSIPDTVTAIRVPFHEPEDNIEEGQFTIAEYKAWCTDVAGWTKTVAAERAGRGAKPLTSSSILMSWTLNPASGRDVDGYYVDALDYIGFDCYSEPNAGYLVKYVNTHPGKPWLVGEFGPKKEDVLAGLGDAQWAATLKKMVDLFQTANVPPSYVAYFQAEVAADYVLDVATQPLSVAYVRSLCQQN